VVAGGIRRYAGLGTLTAAVFGVCQIRLIAPGLPGMSLLPDSAIQGLLERFAVACAALAACCFAMAIHLQHRSVRESSSRAALGPRAVLRVIRSRRWLIGTALAVPGSALHVVALSCAPLVAVQPVGVLSLVLTVVLGARGRTAPAPWLRRVLVALIVAALGLRTGGRTRCLVLATSTAVLFGLGSALMLAGGWLLHQACTSGTPAEVIAATTVIDPLTAVTAVTVGIGVYGEAAGTDPLRRSAAHCWPSPG
jgi:hypothetical protein